MSSLPLWLHAAFSEQYPNDYEKIERGLLSSHAVTLRANTLKTDTARVEEELNKAQISYRRIAWYEDAFIVENASEQELAALPLYQNGEIYLQSLSSMLPPLYLDAKPNENILDMAAAPGGKTAQISALTGGKAFLTACERDKIRCDRLRFNLQRQSVPHVVTMCTDSTKLDDYFSFDRILIDAPCSGSGVLDFRKPLKISETLTKNSAAVQKKMLAKAFRILKKGGTIVYSTCSLLREENEDAVEFAIKKCGASLIPITPPEDIPVLPSRDGTFCVCPDELFEGFFVAKFKKAER